MSTLAERIIQVQDHLGLKNVEFAEAIGLHPSRVSQLRNGYYTKVSKPVIQQVCNRYNINEEWLVNGTGEMFGPEHRYEEIAQFIKEIMTKEPDDFQVRLISLLSRLPSEQWKTLEQFAAQLVVKQEEAMKNDPTL